MATTLEYGFTSLNKKGEELCGDNVEIDKSDGGLTLVLADGLGSGVKANILSTLTSKILCTMLSSGLSLDESMDTVASTLPVCKVRGVAYSTFTAVKVDQSGEGFLAEYDNPPSIYLKNGRRWALERTEREYHGKKISVSPLKLEEGDELIMMSDGVIHAGVGQSLNFGWDIAEVSEFAELRYEEGLSAAALSSIVTNACYELYGKKPGDDTTVLSLRKRKRVPLTVMIGPPVSPEMDGEIVSELMEGEGIKAVCGGTSSQLVARELKRELSVSLECPDRNIPPVGYIDGLDLVCEGAITVNRALELAEIYSAKDFKGEKILKGRDGASKLASYLFNDATDIKILVGRKVNLAHEGLSIANKNKLDVIERLSSLMKGLGKNVVVKYY